ncbi:DUF167 domain-containing protein [Candidatus Pacearchaeota archaeon]|nr:DUF167 domain-containing protein [Candidatus Pacearchaeota archaeon]
MIIKVFAKPGSDKEEIEKISETEYKIYIKEKAEDNKANIAIIKLLSKYFKIHYKKIKIKNPRSRDKIVEIKSMQ